MPVAPIQTKPFRLSFPQVFTPVAIKGSQNDPKFSVSMLFLKDDPFVLELRKQAWAALCDKFGTDRSKWPNPILKTCDIKTYLSPTGKDGWPLRDGDLCPWEGYAGMVAVRASASAKNPPGVVDAMKNPITNQSLVVGGLICRANINAFGYANGGNTGVSFGLNHLQVLKDDGMRYGSRPALDKAFDDDGRSYMDEDDPANYQQGPAEDPFAVPPGGGNAPAGGSESPF